MFSLKCVVILKQGDHLNCWASKFSVSAVRIFFFLRAYYDRAWCGLCFLPSLISDLCLPLSLSSGCPGMPLGIYTNCYWGLACFPRPSVSFLRLINIFYYLQVSLQTLHLISGQVLLFNSLNTLIHVVITCFMLLPSTGG